MIDIEQHIATLRARIEKHGFTMLSVFAAPDGSVPAFTYTIGLQSTCAHPDLIVFGLDPQDAQAMLDTLARRIKAGERVEDRQLLDRVATVTLAARRAVRARDHVSQRFGDGRNDYLQIVLPDPAGHFPWERAFDRKWTDLQPALYD